MSPDTVFHAAAYKHVPLVEENMFEGIKNNLFGTLSQAAIDAGVKKFVLISTDKAVRPTNIMGASKRLAELVLQALSTTQTELFLQWCDLAMCWTHPVRLFRYFVSRSNQAGR